MDNEEFIDYYEILEVSSNANSETIEKVFRYIARRLHPDTSDNHDHERFARVVQAYETLKDPKSRAAYDAEYERNRARQANLIRDAEATGSDALDRRRMLSLFYAKRRRDMKNPGVGTMTLESILGCPEEVLEFHLWYFREKGWITRSETGLLAITAAGVDEIESRDRSWAQDDRLITYAHTGDPHDSNSQVDSSQSAKIFEKHSGHAEHRGSLAAAENAATADRCDGRAQVC